MSCFAKDAIEFPKHGLTSAIYGYYDDQVLLKFFVAVMLHLSLWEIKYDQLFSNITFHVWKEQRPLQLKNNIFLKGSYIRI